MTQRINIVGLRCKVAPCPGSTRVAYLLYPMELPSEWMIRAARHYGAHIVAISDGTHSAPSRKSRDTY